jgi:hypothetical protein
MRIRRIRIEGGRKVIAGLQKRQSESNISRRSDTVNEEANQQQRTIHGSDTGGRETAGELSLTTGSTFRQLSFLPTAGRRDTTLPRTPASVHIRISNPLRFSRPQRAVAWVADDFAFFGVPFERSAKSHGDV